ncbi:hypothetical protein J2X64_000355 [Phycicoccus sp. 3266]|nr:hypothetical protein [Phycicoccus sp. 3266]
MRNLPALFALLVVFLVVVALATLVVKKVWKG